MNLLVTDSVLIDPMFEETVRWQESLREYAYSLDLTHDGYRNLSIGLRHRAREITDASRRTRSDGRSSAGAD
jgi:hypothetical protein